jgi:hypothetical protein
MGCVEYLPPLSDIPLPPEPARDLEDQVTDLLIVNAQLREKLQRYGNYDSTREFAP